MAVLNKLLKPSLVKELETFDGDLIYVLNDEKEVYDSLIENITIDYAEVERAEFNGCHFKNVTFNECNFENASFLECGFNKVVFKECSLEKADFMNTTLKGMDLTDCDISGMLLTGKELRGAYVSSMQAVELSLLLGIIIK